MEKVNLPDEVLMGTFIDSLSVHDAIICHLDEVKKGYVCFSESVCSSLISVVSMFGCREIPKPNSFKELLLKLAHFEFEVKVGPAIAAIKLGIPVQHQDFWKKIRCCDLYSIYNALSVSVDKVLKMIDGCSADNPSQERILCYFKQYIGNMNHNQLRVLLRFITGSCTCSANNIKINFNQLEGLGRRPIAHACSSTLDLPTSYSTYTDFAEEFDNVLHNREHTYAMNAL